MFAAHVNTETADLVSSVGVFAAHGGIGDKKCTQTAGGPLSTCLDYAVEVSPSETGRTGLGPAPVDREALALQHNGTTASSHFRPSQLAGSWILGNNLLWYQWRPKNRFSGIRVGEAERPGPSTDTRICGSGHGSDVANAKSKFQLIVATANGTVWRSIQPFILRTGANVICIQG